MKMYLHVRMLKLYKRFSFIPFLAGIGFCALFLACSSSSNKDTAYSPSMLDSPGGTRAFQATEDMEGTFAVGKAKTLIIIAGYGPISIVGRDTDTIAYKSTKKVSASAFMRGRDSAKTVSKAKKNAKRGVNKTYFESTTRGDQLEIVLRAPEEKDTLYGEISHIYVAADFVVPKDLNVMVENNYGSVIIADINGNVKVAQKGVEVRIRDITGNLQVESANGPLVIGRIGGDANLACFAGDIITQDIMGNLTCRTRRGNVIHLSTDGPKSPTLLQTNDGKIQTYYPLEANFVVEASAARGDVRCSLPIQRTTVSDSHRLAGQLGSGGPKVILRAARGRIEILSKAEFPEVTSDALSEEQMKKEIQKLRETPDDGSGRPLWQQDDPRRSIEILPSKS